MPLEPQGTRRVPESIRGGMGAYGARKVSVPLAALPADRLPLGDPPGRLPRPSVASGTRDHRTGGNR
ncbi:hypothetical protein GCM10023235_74910 [Kitasatospora terrestris]|uniref:Uncharacterized protein n=1 Tax=Kitasatospora terrestris TaxID=258051 RepID=A0ABP9EP29_9ACTN